jgi:hypothetical protein
MCFNSIANHAPYFRLFLRATAWRGSLRNRRIVSAQPLNNFCAIAGELLRKNFSGRTYD